MTHPDPTTPALHSDTRARMEATYREMERLRREIAAESEGDGLPYKERLAELEARYLQPRYS